MTTYTTAKSNALTVDTRRKDKIDEVSRKTEPARMMVVVDGPPMVSKCHRISTGETGGVETPKVPPAHARCDIATLT